MSMRVKREQEVDIPGLGAKIKEARERSPVSVSRLAKEAGISRQYWYQLENETLTTALNELTLRKIEQALGADFGVSFE